MRRSAAIPSISVVVLAVAICGAPMQAQEDPTLDATRRAFPDVGPGFRALRRGPDGSYYVLAMTTASSASKSSKAVPPHMPVVLVFDSQGRKLRQIPTQPRPGEIVSPSSLDLDASGRVYIADQSGNAVSIYTADGTRLAHLRVPEPTQIVALPRDQFAVCSANSERLIAVYDLRGTLLREMGEPADLSDDAELNHRLNVGHLAAVKLAISTSPSGICRSPRYENTTPHRAICSMRFPSPPSICSPWPSRRARKSPGALPESRFPRTKSFQVSVWIPRLRNSGWPWATY